MLPGKVGKTPRSVLVAMLGNGTHGRRTVVPEPRTDRLAVEAPVSVPDPYSTPMQWKRVRKHEDQSTEHCQQA